MTLQQLKYAITISDCCSMNEAAKKLYVSQPSLSEAIKDLEKEIGITIFLRSNRGISLTPEGEEFLSYARQVNDQLCLLEDHYIGKEAKKKFSISTQHYTFAVKAFMETVNNKGFDKYEFAVYETKTAEVIDNVKSFKSEIGVLYLSDFNEQVIKKLLRESGLEFVELFTCNTYVYLSATHPLAKRSRVSMKDLEDYPCLSFAQGNNNSLFLSEELKSTYDYKRIIKANDRATLLNLMTGLNAYTLCSGIICEELNGQAYKAIELEESEIMRIGYIKRKDSKLSSIGQIYVEELKKYEAYAV